MEDRLSEVRRYLKTALPAEAFLPDASRLVHVTGHAVVILLGAYGLGQVEAWWPQVLLAIIMGHSMFCIGVIGHDVSHGTVVRGKWARPIAEVVVWALAGTPATVWDVNHNRVHHKNTNTLQDSFRYFSKDEATLARRIYVTLFYPNRHLRWSPLPLLGPLVQTWAHVLTGLWIPSHQSSTIVTHLGEYTGKRRARIVLEMMVNVAFHCGLFLLMGGSFDKYLLMYFVTSMVFSAGTAAYSFTQHSLFDLTLQNTPLQSMSVRVPAFVDWLHNNVSHHTAHHIYDSVRSTHLPQVTRILAERFPDALGEYPTILQAWARMQRNDPFKNSPRATARPHEFDAAAEPA